MRSDNAGDGVGWSELELSDDDWRDLDDESGLQAAEMVGWPEEEGEPIVPALPHEAMPMPAQRRDLLPVPSCDLAQELAPPPHGAVVLPLGREGGIDAAVALGAADSDDSSAVPAPKNDPERWSSHTQASMEGVLSCEQAYELLVEDSFQPGHRTPRIRQDSQGLHQPGLYKECPKRRLKADPDVDRWRNSGGEKGTSFLRNKDGLQVIRRRYGTVVQPDGTKLKYHEYNLVHQDPGTGKLVDSKDGFGKVVSAEQRQSKGWGATLFHLLPNTRVDPDRTGSDENTFPFAVAVPGGAASGPGSVCRFGSDADDVSEFWETPWPPVPYSPGGTESSSEDGWSEDWDDEAALAQKALRNFEDFYKIPPGTATLDQVGRSSAGVAGWAGADAVAGGGGAANLAVQPKRGHSATGSSVPAKRPCMSSVAATVAAPVVTEPQAVPDQTSPVPSGSIQGDGCRQRHAAAETTADLVARGCRESLSSFEEFEQLLLDDTFVFQQRPQSLESTFGIFRESPKQCRRRPGSKDKWGRNVDKGSALWPRTGPARIRCQSGAVKCPDGRRLRYLEYTLLPDGNPGLSEEKLARHVWQVRPHQRPAARSGTVVPPFVQLAEALSVEQSRPGSGSNARLAALANELLSVRPDVFDVLQAHGFRLGTHANQFDHELSAAEMEAIRLELVQALAANRLSSVPRGHGDQRPAARSGTVVPPFVQLAEALSVEQSRPGSGSNARLAALANELLSVRPDVFDVLQAHGFRLGTHANQFDHELSAAEMEAIRLELVQALAANRLSSVPRGHGDQRPAARSGTVVPPFVQLAEALSVEQSRPGSGSNARLAALANELLSVRPDVFDVLQAHGFRLGTHANQFDHELSAAEMEAIRLELVQALAANRLSSVPRGHGDPQVEVSEPAEATSTAAAARAISPFC